MTDVVLIETVGGVATVTLNRPEAMNACDRALKEALLEVVPAVAADDAVRAVVLTGTGRAFCVGQDLREHAALLATGDPAPLRTVSEHYNPITLAIAGMRKPVVAALNGTAAGAGLGFALACDFRIAAEGARFTTAFTGIGLTADSGLSWSLPRLVGQAKATALLLLAEPFTAEQALEMGLVTAVAPADRVLAAAQELAGRLAQGPTAAYALVKESLAFGATHDLAETLAKEDELQTRAGATQDHRDATAAFVGKQQPVFTGR